MNYSLSLIFILIPLIFSHFFSRLGEVFVIENGIGNFESVKVSIFLLLVISATVEAAFQKGFETKKTLIISLSIIIFLIFEYILFSSASVFGIGEKRHGTLFFAGILWCGYLIFLSEERYIHTLKKLILSTGVIVSLIGLGEALFSYNIFTGYIGDAMRSWGSGRATSTLGNPNYLAGYLLMLLPLAWERKEQLWRYSLMVIFLSGILSTLSFIGIFLAFLFLIFLIEKYFTPLHVRWIFPLTLFLGTLIIFLFLHEGEKWLSLSSRFILMKESFFLWTESIRSITIGGGPNAIIEMYAGSRSDIINSYFPENMIIDSSHNILLDLLIKWGLSGWIVIFLFLGNVWKNLEIGAKQMLLLGIGFFSLNVAILSAYLLFIFALGMKNERR